MEQPDLREQMVQLVLKDLKDLLGLKDLRDLPVHKDLKDPLVRRDHKDLKGQLDRPQPTTLKQFHWKLKLSYYLIQPEQSLTFKFQT